jgi:hypothetical protein
MNQCNPLIEEYHSWIFRILNKRVKYIKHFFNEALIDFFDILYLSNFDIYERINHLVSFRSKICDIYQC